MLQPWLIAKGVREALFLSYKTLDMSQTKNSKLKSKLKNKMLKTSWVLEEKGCIVNFRKNLATKRPRVKLCAHGHCGQNIMI
jgi:hypothetical protein